MFRLKSLQTLNIRNLPEVESVKSWLPAEQMHQGLATIFLEFALSIISYTTRLKTFAIGAQNFEDHTLGVNSFPFDDFRDFLKVRIHTLKISRSKEDEQAVGLTLVAKGTLSDAVFECPGFSIFRLSWLNILPASEQSHL